METYRNIRLMAHNEINIAHYWWDDVNLIRMKQHTYTVTDQRRRQLQRVINALPHHIAFIETTTLITVPKEVS